MTREELAAIGTRARIEPETVTAIVAWLRARNENVNCKDNWADAIERGEWRR